MMSHCHGNREDISYHSVSTSTAVLYKARAHDVCTRAGGEGPGSKGARILDLNLQITIHSPPLHTHTPPHTHPLLTLHPRHPFPLSLNSPAWCTRTCGGRNHRDSRSHAHIVHEVPSSTMQLATENIPGIFHTEIHHHVSVPLHT